MRLPCVPESRAALMNTRGPPHPCASWQNACRCRILPRRFGLRCTCRPAHPGGRRVGTTSTDAGVAGPLRLALQMQLRVCALWAPVYTSAFGVCCAHDCIAALHNCARSSELFLCCAYFKWWAGAVQVVLQQLEDLEAFAEHAEEWPGGRTLHDTAGLPASEQDFTSDCSLLKTTQD